MDLEIVVANHAIEHFGLKSKRAMKAMIRMIHPMG